MNTITIKTTIQAPIEKVWNYWTLPKHIINWNFASNDWCCPSAINNLQPGESFVWRMEAKDGSIGFDFTGTYEKIEKNRLITYKMPDGRNVLISFHPLENEVKVTETFDTEGTHTDEQQRAGWQSILDTFKNYVENN
ncbi:SRPBCC domain-containing protein [Tenacibaculum sp. TC6]|uniref:SRPBCC domain-containing protein n=1 Tax=Tenacibaculum sp. TC6 TaxID=3423223 RepID=UPI003D36C36F